MELILSAFEQSVLFFPLALGIYVSYAVLKTTDMTSEGSFVLGGGVFARLLSQDINSGIGIMISLLSGIFAGIGVSFIQAKEKLNSLIAGIIALFMLYTLNFKIMGRPNIGLPSSASMGLSKTVIFSLIVLLALAMGLLLASRIGLILRAFGNNAPLLKLLGKNIEVYRALGLALSNALAALCGAMTAIVHGFADLGMGFGMTLTGISTVMIGQQLQKRFFSTYSFNIGMELIACFIGVLLYFLAVNSLLALGLDPIYLKFVLGIVLITLLRGKFNISNTRK
jgi:putative ABC transport system permease protein